MRSKVDENSAEVRAEGKDWTIAVVRILKTDRVCCEDLGASRLIVHDQRVKRSSGGVAG